MMVAGGSRGAQGLLLVACALLGLSGRAQTNTAPSGGYRISGHVVNAGTGAPLAGAEVAIVAVPDSPRSESDDSPPQPRNLARGGRRGGPQSVALQAVVTGEDGSFLFPQLPAGKYRLTGSRRGFIESAYEGHGFYSSAIVTGEKLASEGLTLRLSAGAVIGGAVTDSGGDPVDEAAVNLYRLSDDGLGSIHLYRSVNTNDLGEYECAHLPPGTYFVSATGRVWYASRNVDQAESHQAVAPGQNLDVLYARTYYPETSDFHAASPVPVRAGDRIHADLHLVAVPAVHLTAPVQSGESEADAHRVMMPSVSLPSVFDDRDPAPGYGGGMVSMNQDHGQQVVSISVAPGEYEVELNGSTMHVNASGGDLQLRPETAMPSASVTGKLGAAAGTALYDPLSVTLVPADGRGRGAGAEVTHDGSFTVEQVPPGAYVLQVNARGRPLTVTQMEASGAPAAGRVLTVGTQPVNLAALVAPASSVLLGIAQEAGKPLAGVMVVLVPQQIEYHLLFRRDQTDSDGSFVLRDLAPGRYTVVAIRDAWELDWARPSVIAAYLHHGEQVTMTDGDSKVARLPRPVDVQPR